MENKESGKSLFLIYDDFERLSVFCTHWELSRMVKSFFSEEYCIVDYFGQWMFVHGPSGLFLPIEKTFLDFVC